MLGRIRSSLRVRRVARFVFLLGWTRERAYAALAPEEAKEVLDARIVDVMGDTESDILALECTGSGISNWASIEAVRFGGIVFVVGVGKGEMGSIT
jgi:threonine dehydrogenase-like Zn-dependent dehydrogenase